MPELWAMMYLCRRGDVDGGTVGCVELGHVESLWLLLRRLTTISDDPASGGACRRAAADFGLRVRGVVLCYVLGSDGRCCLRLGMRSLHCVCLGMGVCLGLLLGRVRLGMYRWVHLVVAV